MNSNINLLHCLKYSNILSSLLNDNATSINETCDDSQFKLKKLTNINNNMNTCSCTLRLILLQVIVYTS